MVSSRVSVCDMELIGCKPGIRWSEELFWTLASQASVKAVSRSVDELALITSQRCPRRGGRVVWDECGYFGKHVL